MKTIAWVLLAAAACAQTPQKVNFAYYLGEAAKRGYTPRNLVSSGAAGRITHLLYAFAKPTATGCVLDAPEVDRANFAGLAEVKKAYPNLKVLISLGGWLMSDKFSVASSSEASRKAFASSCIDLFVKQNGEVFDGIDIDWEYPAVCGNTCDISPNDTRNFTLLLAEFRRQLDALGKHHLLTIAAPNAPNQYSRIELGKIHKYLDYINLMTYDMHGAWNKKTNHLAGLYANPADTSDAPDSFADRAVTAYLAAGVPASKIVMGVPFYGRGWKGVPNVNNGLFQPATGGAPTDGEPGALAYRKLRELKYSSFRDEAAQAFWVYSAEDGIFWSYDDPASLANKVKYLKSKGLAGVMSWEVSQDDDEGTLMRALAEALK